MLPELPLSPPSMVGQLQQHPACCRATLEQVLEAANWAPTHGKTEPWRFTVLSPEGLDQLIAVSLSVSGLHVHGRHSSKPSLPSEMLMPSSVVCHFYCCLTAPSEGKQEKRSLGLSTHATPRKAADAVPHLPAAGLAHCTA